MDAVVPKPKRPRARREPAPTTPDPIEIAMEAEAHDEAADSPARRLLVDQGRLVRWQIAGERTGVILKVLTGLAGAAAAVAVLAVVWQTSRADGLVVEAFSVPPQFAAQGLTGQAVAATLLDRISEMQNRTETAQPGRIARNDWSTGLKVEIAQTGVSLSEVSRFLRQWLGHETHVTGEVVQRGGDLTVTARVGDSPGQRTAGPEADLDALVQKSAEAIYQQTQPFRYATWLKAAGRMDEAIAAFDSLADNPASPDRALAMSEVARVRFGQGDRQEAKALSDAALRQAPEDPYVANRAKGWAANLGDDEAWLAHAKEAGRLFRRHPEMTTPGYRRLSQAFLQTDFTEVTGDYLAEAEAEETVSNLPDYGGSKSESLAWIGLDLALAHDGAGSERAFARARAMATEKWYLYREQIASNVALGQWSRALEAGAALKAYVAQPYDPRSGPFPGVWVEYFRTGPEAAHLALATAMSADLASGEAMAAATPLDCYVCLRVRGRIAAEKHDRAAVDHWFAEAVRFAPSIPLAYAERGQMLLGRGQPDAAIAQFKISHGKGPHYADALSGWGEALLQQGKAGAAARKFAEADKYAPNWGRNHLKWGEGLAKLGKADEARAQWRTAAGLELTPAERAELARLQGTK